MSYFVQRESNKTHEESIRQYKIQDQNAKTKISYVNGSVEAACALGLADGIVDLVESGETMRAAKLHPIATLMTTEAVFIQNPHKQNPLIETIKRRIEGVIVASRYVLVTYNIEREHLQKATKITPGKRAPTVSPHDNGGWVSVSSMVSKKDVVDIMDQLERIGADDILVTSIQNCRVMN
jgi:ATP phosphoribosyltransferase